MRSIIFKSITTILLWALLSNMGLCQQFSVQQYRPQQGLANSQITALHQDARGFLWIGTKRGLHRYDGRDFKVFLSSRNSSNSLSNNEIRAILEDHNGHIWIGTQDGLNRYDPEKGTFEVFWSDGNGRSLYVHHILEDRWGNIWICTYSGLYRMDSNRNFHSTKLKESGNDQNKNVVWNMMEDSLGDLYVATNTGLHILKRDSLGNIEEEIQFKHELNNQRSVSSSRIWSLTRDRDNNIWVAGGNGICRVTKSDSAGFEFDRYTIDREIPNNIQSRYIESINVDSQNVLWVATPNGLYRADLNAQNPPTLNLQLLKHQPSDPNSMPGNHVNCTLTDREGITWVGTALGLLKHDARLCFPKTVAHVANNPKSTRSNNVVGILVDSKGGTWVALENGEMEYMASERSGFEFEHLKTLKFPVIRMIEDSVGVIWLATVNGLYYAPIHEALKGTWKTITGTQGLTHTRCMNILEERKGVYWVATYGGLNRMVFDPLSNSPPEITGYESDNANPRSHINSLSYSVEKDELGRIWTGTFNGISRYVAATVTDTAWFETWEHDRTDPNSLSYNKVTQILLDSRNRLWAATGSGLNLITGRGKGATVIFRTWTEENGLPTGQVNAIIEDTLGRLWLSDGNGILVFDPETALAENGGSPVVTSFNMETGRMKKGFNPDLIHIDQKGNIWTAGSNGFSIFNPSTIQPNTFLPNVELTEMRLANEPVVASDTTLLTSTIGFTDTIRLSHRQHSFSFRVAAPSFSESEKTRFAFKLEEFNNEWSISDNPTVSYTNIAPGQYSLLVKAANSSGKWTSPQPKLTIIISQPPWKTWWAYTIYGLLFGSLVYAFITFRINLRTRELKREAAVAEVRVQKREALRKKNAADFHDELGHRITKLTLFTELANRQKNDPAQLSDLLQKLTATTRELSEGIRDFIWAFDPEKDSLEHTLLRLQDFGNRLFEYSEVVFRVNGLELAKTELPFDADKRKHLLLLYKEAMNNTLKYAQCSRAWMDMEERNGKLIFRFSDNGKGFDPNTIKRGYGLNNMRKRAEKMGAELSINSSEKDGTRITVVI